MLIVSDIDTALFSSDASTRVRVRALGIPLPLTWRAATAAFAFLWYLVALVFFIDDIGLTLMLAKELDLPCNAATDPV